MAEEAGEPPRLLSSRNGGRLHSAGRHLRFLRYIVQGEINLRPLLCADSVGLNRSRTGGRLFPNRLLLIVIVRTGTILFHHHPRGNMQRYHQHHGKQDQEDHHGDKLGEHRHRPHCQNAGDRTAGNQSHTGNPQIPQDGNGGAIDLLAEQHMSQNTKEHRQQQGAAYPQANRPAVMGQQNAGCQQHGRSCQPVPIAEQALEQHRQPIDKQRADPQITHQGA